VSGPPRDLTPSFATVGRDSHTNTALAFGCLITKVWQNINVGSGSRRSLVFTTSQPISLSKTGSIAGTIASIGTCCKVAAQSSGPSAKVVHFANGYDPTWSQDGRWLYYVTRTKLRSLTFRIQTSLGGHPSWQTVRSFLFHVSIRRSHPNGTHTQVVTSQTAYGFGHLNVLKDGSVIFTAVPSDLNLWRHSHGGVTPAILRRYGPKYRIEWASVGGQPHVLIQGAHLPAVQP
jgi:WD40-like Beta Propeller Repeat